MTTLTVIVLNWNRQAETRECLRRLAGWRELQPEIKVVDNGSTTFEAEALQDEFPAVEWLLSETNLGFGGGNNLALRKVSTEYALLLNGDASVDEGDVSLLIDVLEDDSTVFAVGPLIEDDNGRRTAGGRDIARYAGTHWEVTRLPASGRLSKDLYEVDYCPGTVALVRTSVVRGLGYLDERYFFGGELADLCEKARRRGLRTAVLVSATARHDSSLASEWRSDLYPYYSLRNRFLFVRELRRRSSILLLPSWTAYGLFAIARAVAGRRPWLARALALAVADGLIGRFGGQNHRVLRASRGSESGD